MKVVSIIPARGGSKRFPRKNIHDFNGKPMLYWSIKACKESKYNIEPWVSSEDDEILSIAKKYGSNIIERSIILSDDDVPKQKVIVDVLYKNYKWSMLNPPDIVISLQANSPEIKSQHLDDAIDLLIKEEKQEIFSVDENLMQNGAFRVMRYKYALQQSLSTNCGVIVCNLVDVHYKEDLEKLK